ncbi:MAG: hypothetical protein IPG81_06915 [Sandaracinaceae bacterium]|nr:hypothetical protein [Sandaracinaceae bacterium]
MRRSALAPAVVSLALVLALQSTGCGGNDNTPTPDGGDMGGGFRDNGMIDMGPDLGPLVCTASALAGEIGGACRGVARECNGTQVCIGELRSTVGGVQDPILDVPDGGPESFELVDFPGDYCAPALATALRCSTADRAACASVCGVCVSNIFSDANLCLKQCTPNAVDNDICRNNYECNMLNGACDTGCASDDECRTSREDTDMNGMIEPFDVDTGLGDRIVYRPESQAFCSPDTFRCEHPGTPGAEAGDPCESNDECEANGRCLDEVRFEFPGGYCSKYRCDFEGNSWAGAGSVCNSRGVGLPSCLAGCTLGTGVTQGDTSTYLNNTQGCRTGYACVWDGRSAAEPMNGSCLPGEYNSVTEPNIGAPCSTTDDCYSPFGQGVCLTTGYPGGYCSVLDCGTVGMPADLCGPSAACVIIGAGTRVCLASCSTADDCRLGYACGDIDSDPLTPGSTCFADCLSDEECRDGETCVSGSCAD